jgi:hypothetical protein
MMSIKVRLLDYLAYQYDEKHLGPWDPDPNQRLEYGLVDSKRSKIKTRK